MEEKNSLGKHVLIIGGGFASLLSSRVLADYFEKITIIERDDAAAVGTFLPRKGIPQGLQLHTLSVTAAEILKDLFPGLEKILLSKGAIKCDPLEEGHHYISGWKPRIPFGMTTYYQTRPVLEDSLRWLLKEYSNIEFLYETEVRELLANSTEKRITGVRVINKKTMVESDLYADLVVDASGYGTNFPYWLQALGFEQPKKNEIDDDSNYLTRTYRVPENSDIDWKTLLIAREKPTKTGGARGGAVNVIENDAEGKRIIVSLAGQFGDYPVNTEEGYLEFASLLEDQEIYKVIKQLTPLTSPVSFKFPKNYRYLYHKVKRLPKGFIAIGDSIAAFNPRLGHGMTVASLEAVALKKVLMQKKDIQEYFKEIAKLINRIWSFYVDEQLFFHKKGEKLSLLNSLKIKYKKRLLAMSNIYPEVWKKMYAFYTLKKPSSLLFHPLILFYMVFGKYPR